MAFVNKYSSIIRRSNKSIVNIYEDEKIFFNFYDENNNLIKSKTLSKNIDLSTLHFSLTKNDEIIGLYDDNSLKMIKIDKNDDITNQVVINYDSNQFKTIFPYIEKIDDEVHIFYYVYSLNSDDTLAFFHHYQKDGFWTENNIDFINNFIIDKFTIIFEKNTPIAFYLNIVDGFEEVFYSRFNKKTLKWSKPYQITNSNKNKLYLSVMKNDFFNITFLEKDDVGYRVRYLKFKDKIIKSKSITDSSLYMYPSLLEYNKTLYIMFCDNNRIYNSKSMDNCDTWSEISLDTYSLENDFCKSYFLSNYEDDKSYNCTNVFSVYKNLDILGY